MNALAISKSRNFKSMTKEERRNWMKLTLARALPYFLFVAFVFLYLTNAGYIGFAQDAGTSADKAFEIVLKAVRIIATVVGALFILVGVIKFVVAHANEDGPNQQKAALMIATGVALILVSAILLDNDFTDMINKTGEAAGGGGATGGGGASALIMRGKSLLFK